MTDQMEDFKSGFVTLVGRPNSGKSTLLNAVMGEKIAITSNTPQTTRHRLRAIYDDDEIQMILVDTPGLHKPHDALGEELNHSAIKALEDVDVVAMLVDSTKPAGKGDAWIAEQLAQVDCPRILVLSKADIATQQQVDAQMERMREMLDFDDVVVVSAKDGFNVDAFIDAVAKYLPPGPRWFPKDMTTDQPLEVLVAEFIREKILYLTHDEVPHSIGVQTEEIKYDKAKKMYRIWAVVYTERESQKGIIIGKGGELIKRIGSDARQDLERMLGKKVFLDLSVKVKKAWRRDAAQIKRFGYGEGL